MSDPAPPAANLPPDPPPGSGPRRIRSLPDRPARPRPAGGIRSLPERAPVSARLPGTDAASYGGDMSWRRGTVVLWTLFGLIAAGEAFILAVYLLAGGSHWPTVGDALRLSALGGVFVALWFGWTWTRWVLAVVAFLVGMGRLMLSFRADYHGLNAESAQLAQAVGTLFFLGVLLAVGALYLILSAYLVFSADVLAFTRHRREEGRQWVIFPVGLAVGSYWVAMIGAHFVLHRGLESMRPTLALLARKDAETVAANWDPNALPTFLDAGALNAWPDAGRQNLMNVLRPLGSYLGPGDEDALVSTRADQIGTRFFIRGTCHETLRCTEGRVTFLFAFARPISGPWRAVDLSVGNIQFYKPPAPAAAPTPVPVTPAATPVPSTGG